MRKLALALLACLLLTMPALAGPPAYKDGTAHEVRLGQNAQRIVSLAPAATEMLFYLGFGDHVVGRSEYCNYPPEANRLPSVGGFTDTSLEKIVALKPDLVVAYQGNNLKLVSQLRQLKIEVLALPEATSLAEIGRQMLTLKQVAGDGSSASNDSSIESWRKRLKTLDHQATQHAASIFYGMPGEITYSAAPGSFLDDLINCAGGRNVVPRGRERWPQVGAEFIVAAQPEWLLVSTPCAGHTEIGKATDDIRKSLAKDPVWNKLNAVKQNHIVVINADVLLRPGPRILDALEQLESAIGGHK